MPEKDSLRRLGGGRWETRDGRFAIEPQSGTWVIVDNEQTDELGLPLVRGPFGSLTAAKEAIEAARSEGPKASPLAERIERARTSAKASTAGAGERAAGGGGRGRSGGSAAKRGGVAEPVPAETAGSAVPAERAVPAETVGSAAPAIPAEPASPPEPRWLRELTPADQRRARDLIARLERMGADDPERIARAEIADGQPALARLAVERAVAKALAAKGSVRAAVRSVVAGADVELGVSWRLVDGDGRRIEKVDLPE